MNHPIILAVVHQAVVFRSKSLRGPGSAESGSVVLPVGFTSLLSGWLGTVLDRNGPSVFP